MEWTFNLNYNKISSSAHLIYQLPYDKRLNHISLLFQTKTSSNVIKPHLYNE